MVDVTHRILIGSKGWQYPDWQDQFYPDDLPPEWQLGYYSNEFPVVLVPATYWQDDADAIIESLEDCNENLFVIYEVPVVIRPSSTVSEIRDTLQAFLQRLIDVPRPSGALLLQADTVDFPFAELLAGLDTGADVLFSFTQATDHASITKLMPELQAHGAGVVWHGANGGEWLQQGQVALTLIEQQMDMRQLRQVIETILANTTPEQTSVLIFLGEPPALELMRNATVMLDLF